MSGYIAIFIYLYLDTYAHSCHSNLAVPGRNHGVDIFVFGHNLLGLACLQGPASSVLSPVMFYNTDI